MEDWFGNLLFNNTAVWEGGGIIRSNMSYSLLPATLQKMNGCFNPVLVTSVSCLCALHH